MTILRYIPTLLKSMLKHQGTVVFTESGSMLTCISHKAAQRLKFPDS